MPIIVDRRRGQRLCRVVNNGDKQNLIEDLLCALKGLVIKFEVKITDLVVPNEEEPEEEEQKHEQEPPKPKKVPVNLPEEPKVSAPPSKEVNSPPTASPRQREIVDEAPKEKRNICTSVERELIADPAKEKINSIRAPIEREVVAESSREKRITFIPPSVEREMLTPDITKERRPIINHIDQIKKLPEKVVEAPVTEVIRSSPEKPKLIRGSLNVGSIIKTCCIALDDREQPPIAYISYDTSKLVAIANLLSQFSKEIEDLPPVKSLKVGDIVYAKSNEDNLWYRSIVEDSIANDVEIFFFDWGLRETLSISRTKYITHPELGLSNYPACALKISFSEDSVATREFLKSESEFNLKIKSYDNSTETYIATVMNSG